MEVKLFCVYIMTNQRRTVLYTGVTSNLPQRVWQHKNHALPGFTTRYNVDQLVYFEAGGSAEGAIIREKQIKAGSRARKIALIESQNPKWCDLSDDL